MLLLAAVNIYIYFDAAFVVILLVRIAAAGILGLRLRLVSGLVTAVYIDVQFNAFFVIVAFHDNFSFLSDVLRKANRFTFLYRIC